VSGNRDDRQFTRPDDLWIERPYARRHLSFGFGIHRCVGLHLAELQVRTLLEELLRRDLEIEILAEPTRLPSPFVNGYSALWVKASRDVRTVQQPPEIVSTGLAP